MSGPAIERRMAELEQLYQLSQSLLAARPLSEQKKGIIKKKLQ